VKIILSITIGSLLGTLSRLLINSISLYTLFPIWTVMENIVGSCLLGILTGYVLTKTIPDHLKVGVGVGFCGSFTTMSTFAYDLYLLSHDSILYLFLYFSISLIGGLGASLLGIILGNKWAIRKAGVMRE
jgi:CrcB protein